MNPTEISSHLDRIRSEVSEPLAEIKARLREAEQKLDRRGSDDSFDLDRKDYLARILEKSSGFAAMRDGQTPQCRVELPLAFTKTLSGNVGGGGGALLQPQRMAGIVTPAQRRLTIRDLLPSLPTDAASVEFVRETSFTNNAAVVSETTQKPESSLVFELQTAKVVTIAHWLHASKQILDDVPQLQMFLDTRLRYGLRYAEEVQILTGSGVNNNLRGIYTAATTFADPITYSSPTLLDTLRLAMAQLEIAGYEATGVVMNPIDWLKVELLKTDDKAYLRSNPNAGNARTVWGLPAVVTNAMSSGAFLIGDFQQAAMLFDRQAPTLDIATQDADDFQKNLCKLRVEERVTLANQLPGALVKGSFA